MDIVSNVKPLQSNLHYADLLAVLCFIQGRPMFHCVWRKKLISSPAWAEFFNEEAYEQGLPRLTQHK